MCMRVNGVLIWCGVQSPVDEILLHGHAGITQASPVVIKEVCLGAACLSTCLSGVLLSSISAEIQYISCAYSGCIALT